MRKRDFERLRAKKVSTLGVSRSQLLYLAKFVVSRHDIRKLERLENASFSAKDRRERDAEAAALTAGAVMDACSLPYNKETAWYYKSVPVDFLQLLERHGMDHLDWPLLRPESAHDRLTRCKKSQILPLDVRALGTLSSRAISFLARLLLLPAGEPLTIAKLIADVTYDDMVSSRRNFDDSYHRTRVQLVQLGFGYEDGPFFQIGTRRRATERLMDTHKLTRGTAGKIIGVALKEGWVKFPVMDSKSRGERPHA